MSTVGIISKLDELLDSTNRRDYYVCMDPVHKKSKATI